MEKAVNPDSLAERGAFIAGGSRRRVSGVLAAVVLLHLALLLGVLLNPAAIEKHTPAATLNERVSWLRLLPAQPASPGSATIASSAAPKPPTRAEVPRRQARQSPAPGITWVPAPAFPAASAAPASPAAASAPRPLALTLPPAAPGTARPWRNPALEDPRSNTRALTLEARLAQIMGPGDGPLIETTLPDGRRRFRRGSDCVVVQPSRAEALDSFNSSFSPKAKQVDSC